MLFARFKVKKNTHTTHIYSYINNVNRYPLKMRKLCKCLVCEWHKIICTRSTVCQISNVSSHALIIFFHSPSSHPFFSLLHNVHSLLALSYVHSVSVTSCDLIPLRIKLRCSITRCSEFGSGTSMPKNGGFPILYRHGGVCQ